MTPVNQTKNRRILVIDDNESIHEGFRKILCGAGVTEALTNDEAALFGTMPKSSLSVEFEVESAFQGADGVALAREAFRADCPYALAFVDVRMPRDGMASRPSCISGRRIPISWWWSARPIPTIHGRK